MKARVLSAKYGPRNRGEENDLGWQELVELDEHGQRAVNREIEEGIRNLIRQNRITESMAIGQFLSPRDENINDDAEVIVDEIAKTYSIGDKTHETDEEDVVVPILKQYTFFKNFVFMRSCMKMEIVSGFRLLIDMKE